MAVGIWAWTEKDTFSNLQRLTNVALDPAFILIVAGAVTFIIGFTGCVGALRENTVLLSAVWCYNIFSFHESLYWTILFFFQYAIFLAILLLLEMTAGILGFIFKDWVGHSIVSKKNCLYLIWKSMSYLDQTTSHRRISSIYSTLSGWPWSTEFDWLDTRRMGN